MEVHGIDSDKLAKDISLILRGKEIKKSTLTWDTRLVTQYLCNHDLKG